MIGSGAADFQLVSHAAAGSGPSLMMHALADGLLEAGLAARAHVTDLPGDDGAEAINFIAAHRASAHVAGSCTPTYLTTPMKRHMAVTYRGLTPLGLLVADTYLLGIRSDARAENAGDLFRSATRVAAAPRGGNTHIQALLLADVTSQPVELLFYPSIAQAVAAVARGEADWTTGVATDFSSEVQAGRIRIVATFSGADEPSPEAPRLVDQGIPVSFRLWRGLIGPPALTRRDIQAWEERLAAVRGTAAWSGYLTKSRVRDAPSDARTFGSLLEAEAARYAEWLSRLG